MRQKLFIPDIAKIGFVFLNLYCLVTKICNVPSTNIAHTIADKLVFDGEVIRQ